ncbi:AraC family transcriptional regulator [Winogradskyella sp.]|uniref:AraC family transcriptional regulator n=1 Tax=Winogradskyella sp. TaxID=1883156 RepID=UPI002617176A|nr:AraC family transcriptional regulator [Winogradskyella sp.]
MKPELEQIDLKASASSFRYFNIEVDTFTPFWHYHPELELTLITKGKGTRFVGDSIAPFSDFDLVLIGENVPHHWVSSIHNEEQQSAIVIQFEADLFSNFRECEAFAILFDLAKRGIQFANPSETITKSILAFDGLQPIEQLSLLLKLLADLEQYEHKQLLTSEGYNLNEKLKFSESKFSKVNSYILEHLHEKLTVNDMANFVHMVPQSFCRWFKKHSGHSFISFLNLARIERACQDLITTTEPIQTIALSCGFETLSHFNRTFKKLKGVSPREFRQNKKPSL